MTYEIVELGEKLVEGISIKTSNTNPNMQKEIGGLWQRFLTEESGKIEQKQNRKTIGIYTDYEGDYTKPYRFMTMAEIKEPSSDIGEREIRTIQAGKYAKFVVKGDMQTEVAKCWNAIWNMDLDRKYTYDFEEYQDIEAMNNQEIHIYIAIR